MIEYIKLLILSIFSAATLPLPVSSAAHYSFLNSVLDFSSDTKSLAFYYAAMGVAFSIVVMILLRKIYITGIKSLFDKKDNLVNYKRLMKNLLISLLPMAVLFIPVGEDKLLCDLFDGFLAESNLLLIGVATIFSGLIIVISVWYTKQSYDVTKKGADMKSVIRTSVYQIVSYVIPGMSHVSSACTNMLICDVESKVIVREIYLYIAPQMLLVNLVKIVRYLLTDMVINPVMVIIAVLSVALISTLVITKMSKINIRRLLGFFACYSVASGVIFAVLSFVLK